MSMREQARAAMARTYGEGILAGVEMTLDHLEGKQGTGGTPYEGELPPELRIWIANVRTAIAEEQSHE